MYSGSLPCRKARSSAAVGRPRVVADQVGHQALAARAVLARQHHGLPHRRVLQQRRLDLAQLDAEAADLDLVVQPPQELQVAVGPPAHPVARPVQPGPGSAPNGSGTKRSAVRSGRFR